MMGESKDTDEQLFSRYQRNGDQEAFAFLMKRHVGLVMKTCRRVLNTESDVEDLAQEVFIKMSMSSLQLNSRETSLAGWLRRVALREALNMRVSKQARWVRERHVAEARGTRAREGADSDEGEYSRILQILDEELLALKGSYRDALYAFYMDGQSVREIAEATGKNTQCVKDLLRNGREKLGERIKKRIGVTQAVVIGVLENLPEAPPLREGFIEETTRAAMQIRNGLTPTGLNPNVTQLLAAKGSWTLSKILAGASALLICVAGGAVAVHQVLAHRSPPAAKVAAPVTAGMVLIPGGANAGTDPDTGKTYSLTVESFLMDRCEVSKGLWDEVAGWAREHGYVFPQLIVAQNAAQITGLGKAPDHPVHSVSWWDCVLWCNARSEKDGLDPIYYNDQRCTVITRTWPSRQGPPFGGPFLKATADGYRLPTLVEWQYAACGGKSSHRFPWHDTDTIDPTRANYGSQVSHVWDKSPTRGFHPTYAVDPMPYTSPVGAFPANAYGLYDMAGNVSEWCADEAAGVTNRKYTGGSWRTIMRVHGSANQRVFEREFDYCGFRTVRTPRASVPPHTGPDP